MIARETEKVKEGKRSERKKVEIKGKKGEIKWLKERGEEKERWG